MNPYRQAYQNAYDEAGRAWLDNNFRLAADKYWKSIQLAPDGVWTKYRFHCMQCYVNFLQDKIIVPSKKDYKRLETHIVNNEDEPNVFRAYAALCLGFMYFHDKKDCDQAAESLRDCIDLSDRASPEEKGRVDEYVKLGDGPPRPRPLSGVFDELKKEALKFLRKVERGEVFGEPAPVLDPVRSPWCVYPRPALVPIFGDIPTEQMERRMASGGATCDGCGVARDSTDRIRLLVCGKCNMAYYCSKECQVEQWKRRGHKEACRKPRMFRADDVVRYVLQESDHAIVLRLKRLVDGEAGDGGRKWDAYCGTKEGGLFSIVVDESRLSHIRPADIV